MQTLTKLKKPDLLVYIDKLEIENTQLRLKLNSMELTVKQSDDYVTLESEKEELEIKNQELTDKLETLEAKIDAKYVSMLYQVKQLLSTLDGVAQPYSILDNDIHFLKSVIEVQIIEIEKDLEECLEKL
jgi:uncharacterized protein YPO0396